MLGSIFVISKKGPGSYTHVHSHTYIHTRIPAPNLAVKDPVRPLDSVKG